MLAAIRPVMGDYEVEVRPAAMDGTLIVVRPRAG